jgi:hypothetical protein
MPKQARPSEQAKTKLLGVKLYHAQPTRRSPLRKRAAGKGDGSKAQGRPKEGWNRHDGLEVIVEGFESRGFILRWQVEHGVSVCTVSTPSIRQPPINTDPYLQPCPSVAPRGGSLVKKNNTTDNATPTTGVISYDHHFYHPLSCLSQPYMVERLAAPIATSRRLQQPARFCESWRLTDADMF